MIFRSAEPGELFHGFDIILTYKVSERRTSDKLSPSDVRHHVIPQLKRGNECTRTMITHCLALRIIRISCEYSERRNNNRHKSRRFSPIGQNF